MYQEMSGVNPPPPEATLWRYMNFAQFVSMLKESSLFFTRIDKFGDPFEGLPGLVNRELHSDWYTDLPDERRNEMPGNWNILRRYIAANCWHCNEYESEAMWNRYSHGSDGIAVKTKLSSLAASFTDPTAIYIGQISYLDYDTTEVPETSIFAPSLHKRGSFKHEREVRALILELPPSEGTGFHSGLPDVWKAGRNCTVNLGILVHEVVVSPLVEDWLADLVSSMAEMYRLQATVTRSTLADAPP